MYRTVSSGDTYYVLMSQYYYVFFSLQTEAGSRESLALVEDGCNIWDEGPDCELNIRFGKRRSGEEVVVGATFNKLVERITSVTDHGKCNCYVTFML